MQRKAKSKKAQEKELLPPPPPPPPPTESKKQPVFSRQDCSGIIHQRGGRVVRFRRHRLYDERRQTAFGDRGFEKWPEHSPFRCWNCNCFFDNMPMMLPWSLSASGIFELYGNFCTVACANRFAVQDPHFATDTKRALLRLLVHRVFGLSPSERMPMAPPFTDLEEYGGDMTREEYQAHCKQNDFVVTMRQRPFVSFVSALSALEEQYYGTKEGGRGEDAIVQAIYEDTVSKEREALTAAVAAKVETSVRLKLHNDGVPAQGNKLNTTSVVPEDKRKRWQAARNDYRSQLDLKNVHPPSAEEIEMRLQHRARIRPHEGLFERLIADTNDKVIGKKNAKKVSDVIEDTESATAVATEEQEEEDETEETEDEENVRKKKLKRQRAAAKPITSAKKRRSVAFKDNDNEDEDED